MIRYPSSRVHLMEKQTEPFGLPSGWQVATPFSPIARTKSTVVWTVSNSLSVASPRLKATKLICVSDVMIGVTKAWLKTGYRLFSNVLVFMRYFWSKYIFTYGFVSSSSDSNVPLKIDITAFPVSGGSMHVPLMHLKASCREREHSSCYFMAGLVSRQAVLLSQSIVWQLHEGLSAAKQQKYGRHIETIVMIEKEEVGVLPAAKQQWKEKSEGSKYERNALLPPLVFKSWHSISLRFPIDYLTSFSP